MTNQRMDVNRNDKNTEEVTRKALFSAFLRTRTLQSLQGRKQSDIQNLWDRSHKSYSTLVKAYQLLIPKL